MNGFPLWIRIRWYSWHGKILNRYVYWAPKPLFWDPKRTPNVISRKDTLVQLAWKNTKLVCFLGPNSPIPGPKKGPKHHLKALGAYTSTDFVLMYSIGTKILYIVEIKLYQVFITFMECLIHNFGKTRISVHSWPTHFSRSFRVSRPCILVVHESTYHYF